MGQFVTTSDVFTGPYLGPLVLFSGTIVSGAIIFSAIFFREHFLRNTVTELRRYFTRRMDESPYIASSKSACL